MVNESEKDFYRNGFLGSQISEVTEAILKKYDSYFTLCHKLNELSYKTMPEAKANNNNLQQILAVTLFIRILNGFQSVIILARLGLAFDAKVVLRGLLESSFIGKLICEEKDFALEYVKSDECRRLKLLNVAKQSTAPHFNSLRQIATDSELRKLKEAIKEQNCKEIGIEDVAKRARLQIEYDTDYRLLCEETHTLPRSIEHLTIVDPTGEPLEFDPNPTDKDLSYILFSAVRFLYIALVSFCTLFDLDKKAELREINERLQALRLQVTIRSDSTLVKPS